MAFTTRHETTFGRGLRTIAEASLVAALGFSVAVLLIGTPIALLVRGLHEGLSWLTRLGDMTGPLIEALVAVASSLGGVLLFALSVRFLLKSTRTAKPFRGAVGKNLKLEIAVPRQDVTLSVLKHRVSQDSLLEGESSEADGTSRFDQLAAIGGSPEGEFVRFQRHSLGEIDRSIHPELNPCPSGG